MDISNLTKVDGWYRGAEKQWEFDKYGFFPCGMSDLIYNNLRKIIEDNDTSSWAYDVFDKCVSLLLQGKRWPDEMNQDDVEGKVEYRSQYSMTRDPWILFYAACIHLDKREFVYLKPPRKLYRANLWELRKALLGRKNSYLFWKKFHDIFHMIIPREDFVVILEYYRNWSYERKNIDETVG